MSATVTNHAPVALATVSPNPTKPAILCLHGGGTNVTIFKVQTIRIQRALSSHFEFVFLDAPFEAEPGPGVHPVFEGCGPYFRWVLDHNRVEMPEKTRAIIRECSEEQRRKDGRGFVGVLGFSQGARVAAGLLLEQQLGKPSAAVGDDLCFGIFLNGTCPPLTSRLTEEERAERIVYPTLSVLGLQDPWREDGQKLFSQHCDSKAAKLLEFDIGHRLPILEEDTAKITTEILRMHRKASGRHAAQLNGIAG